ncbi:MAG: tetratricopeptide repeat protein [Myxococcales bacterium]
MSLKVLALLTFVQTSDPAADLDKGRVAARAGDVKTAEVHLRRATQTFPTWGLAQIELAEVLLAQGPDTAGLPSALAAARSLEPHNPRAWRLTGLFHEQKNELGQAIDAYRRAVEIRPDLLECRERLGVLLAHEGRHKEAIPELAAVTSARPSEWGLRATLAEAYEREGQLEPAEAELRAVADGSGSPLFRRRLAQFYERTGQPKKAEAEYRRADAGRPEKKMRALPASKW